MFDLEWDKNSINELYEETQNNLKKIDGINEFVKLQQAVYRLNDDGLCWGDDQIDGLSFLPKEERLTVYLVSYRDFSYEGDAKEYHEEHYVIDFFGVEIFRFDIQPCHWIDDVLIHRNSDGKYSISFGTGELDFRYSYAKVNRCWVK